MKLTFPISLLGSVFKIVFKETKKILIALFFDNCYLQDTKKNKDKGLFPTE